MTRHQTTSSQIYAIIKHFLIFLNSLLLLSRTAVPTGY